MEGKQLSIPHPAEEDFLADAEVLDFETYDYFAQVTVYSSRISITDRSSQGAGKLLTAYAKEGVVKLVDDIYPVPQLEICRLGSNNNANPHWYLHLKNPEDYKNGTQAIAQDLRIHAKIYGKDVTIDPLSPGRVVFNGGGSNYLEYTAQIPSHTQGGEGTFEYWVSGGGAEGKRYQKTIYLPANDSDPVPGAAIGLTDAYAELSGRTLTIHGTMTYNGAQNPPTLDQRFGLALIRPINNHPQQILAMTSGDQDLRVKAGGDAVSLERTLEIPSWISEEDIAVAKLCLFYKGNDYDDPDQTVTHFTDFTKSYDAQNAGKKYLFRDRSATSQEDQEHGYFCASLHMDNNSIQGTKATIEIR